MPEPQRHGVPATSAIYTAAHSIAGSLTQWARPGIELKTSWFLVRFVNHWAMTGTPLFFFLIEVEFTVKFTLFSEFSLDKHTVVWLPPQSKYSSFITLHISLCTFCSWSFPLDSLSLATTGLFSILIGLCGFVILRMSYRWNYTICSLLSLAFLT